MYKLICGNVFDKKCDLIIIPCSDSGRVTIGVQRDLMVNEIPYYGTEIDVGAIYFQTSVGSFTNASSIGFAASVKAGYDSEIEYITSILESIKSFCRENNYNVINIPLLGTGAGEIEYSISFKLIKSFFHDDKDLLVNIFAYTNEIYRMLDEIDIENESLDLKSPRVFLSYASNSSENQEWVKDLASKLRTNGVDARMDLFHLKAGQDLPQWMTNELILAEKVLLICDKYYVEKSDSRKGGVGWETMIIQGDMMSNLNANKYICIIRESEIDQGLPIFVKSKLGILWNENTFPQDKFDSLLFNIFDCNIEPPLGKIPDFIKEKLLTKN